MVFWGKVVLITGASSGIGAATAVLFAERRAHVVLVGRNLKNLEESEKKCIAANNEIQTLVIQADVTNEAEKIINQTIAKFGRLDVLVNNAGISQGSLFMDTPVEVLDTLINTNVRSVYILTKLAVPHLLKTKGNIINVSSIASVQSKPTMINYAISKAALDQFTKCLAMELAPKQVRVNSVNPATIETEIFARSGIADVPKYLKKMATVHPLGRVGNVTEVAKSIAFLASDDASFITGTRLLVDGGRAVSSL